MFRDQLRQSLGVGNRDFVFFDQDGEPARSEDLHENVWKPALRRAKLRYRVSYAMRHTFISHALMQGEPINWVAHVSGTSIAMIERHHEKWVPKDLGYGCRVAASLFGDQMGRKVGRNDDLSEKSQETYTTPTGFENEVNREITKDFSACSRQKWAKSGRFSSLLTPGVSSSVG